MASGSAAKVERDRLLVKIPLKLIFKAPPHTLFYDLKSNVLSIRANSFEHFSNEKNVNCVFCQQVRSAEELVSIANIQTRLL